MEPIKILIIEDSLLLREIAARGLKRRLPKTTKIEQVGDAIAASDKIHSFKPNVIVADLDIPDKSGIELLRQLLVQCNLPVVVSSSRPVDRSLAMEAGAFAFLEKPLKTFGIGTYFNNLAAEIRLAKEYGASPSNNKTQMDMPLKEELGYKRGDCTKDCYVPKKNMGKKVELIALGASTGGTDALSKVLRELKPPLPPIVIVQHIPPTFSKLFANRLNDECHISVKEAQNGEELQPNWAYVAPGDKQMRVKKINGGMQLDVNKGAKVNGHCPSVDVLFDSVAEQVGNTALGVILTGMGADGANGLLKMRQHGATTIGQDKATCIVYGMPRAAYERGAVQKQLPLADIPAMITSVVCGRKRF